jgi:tRNA pseudouridine32 synthase/23S rRNA pseudouridine746 synthase
LTLNGAAVPRLMLHAQALAFPHPEGGEKRIEAPWPQDLIGVAQYAGLHSPMTMR